MMPFMSVKLDLPQATSPSEPVLSWVFYVSITYYIFLGVAISKFLLRSRKAANKSSLNFDRSRKAANKSSLNFDRSHN